MQKPATDSAYIHKVRFGLYTVRRLVIKGQDDLAGPVRDASRNLLDLGRKWDDAGLNAQEGYANRDAVDDDLDVLAQRIRQNLANRDLGADRKMPYTAIFPDNITQYTLALVDGEIGTYQLLISRIEANLAEDDVVRTEFVPQVKTLLEQYSQAASALSGLLNTETVARDGLESAVTAWEKLIDDTFAELSKRFDKKKAEQFFRKDKSRK